MQGGMRADGDAGRMKQDTEAPCLAILCFMGSFGQRMEPVVRLHASMIGHKYSHELLLSKYRNIARDMLKLWVQPLPEFKVMINSLIPLRLLGIHSYVAEVKAPLRLSCSFELREMLNFNER